MTAAAAIVAMALVAVLATGAQHGWGERDCVQRVDKDAYARLCFGCHASGLDHPGMGPITREEHANLVWAVNAVYVVKECEE